MFIVPPSGCERSNANSVTTSSLEEVNAPPDADMPIWDLPPDRRSRGRDSFHAAAAARQQGREAFERFHTELLTLKHEEGQDHGKRSTLNEAASRAGLDLTRFAADLNDSGLLAEIKVDGGFRPGDLVRADKEVVVAVRVLGPEWSKASNVTLYANGVAIRESPVPP